MIVAENITKTFGKTRALDGFDLVVQPGEVHGFLGPNGAGKSTTIRAILGQIRLDSGQLTVFDRHPWRDAVDIHANLSYVPGDVVLWPNLTGGEALDMLHRFHPRDDRRRRCELLEAFDLDPSKKGRAYSKGNRQKVALISALAADVDLYIFDEPTSGLDPLMESVFQQCVRDRVAEGATVLLSSHILDEVDALCSHVTIIRDGRRVAHGSLEEIRNSTLTTVDARLSDPQAIERLSALPGVREATSFDGHLRLAVVAAELNAVLGRVTDENPASLTVRPPTLDEVFHSHYEAD